MKTSFHDYLIFVNNLNKQKAKQAMEDKLSVVLVLHIICWQIIYVWRYMDMKSIFVVTPPQSHKHSTYVVGLMWGRDQLCPTP